MRRQYNLTPSATQGNNLSILITHFYVHNFFDIFLNWRGWFFSQFRLCSCPINCMPISPQSQTWIRLHVWTLNGENPPHGHNSCGCSCLHPIYQESGSLTWELSLAQLIHAPASFNSFPLGLHHQMSITFASQSPRTHYPTGSFTTQFHFLLHSLNLMRGRQQSNHLVWSLHISDFLLEQASR